MRGTFTIHCCAGWYHTPPSLTQNIQCRKKWICLSSRSEVLCFPSSTLENGFCSAGGDRQWADMSRALYGCCDGIVEWISKESVSNVNYLRFSVLASQICWGSGARKPIWLEPLPVRDKEDQYCMLVVTVNQRFHHQSLFLHCEWFIKCCCCYRFAVSPTIQLIPKTPSEKTKRLRIWRRHGAALGYRRFSNRTASFR